MRSTSIAPLHTADPSLFPRLTAIKVLAIAIFFVVALIIDVGGIGLVPFLSFVRRTHQPLAEIPKSTSVLGTGEILEPSPMESRASPRSLSSQGRCTRAARALAS